MADINNRDHIYLVDPGIGEKVTGCPYSIFEDGRDVKDCIIPPEGYELSEFKFEPYDSPDHFYDGKVVAQYVKQKTVRPPLWKFITAAVAVIGIIVGIIMFFSIRNNKQEEVIVYPAAEVVASLDDSIATTPTEVTEAQKTTVEPKAVVEQKAKPVKEEVVKNEVVKEENVQAPAKEVVKTEETPLQTNETTAQFKEEFWTLIHQQESKMPAYGKLFRTYKGKVESEEYKYLGWTILRSTKDFAVWNDILLSVPSDKISTVNNIDQLTKLLEEYEQ